MATGKHGLGRQGVADLAVLLALAGVVAVYAYDAISASTALLHLILVLPVSACILFLCLLQFIRTLLAPASAPAASAAEPGAAADVAVVVALFVAYVASLEWLGFDAGTCLFVAAFLRLHGERRPVWLLGYSIAFGLGLAFAFSALLPYPMPLRLLPGGAG
jgi:hypothetical protein